MRTLAVLFSLVFLAACEGESRPFQEAVEIETLGLTDIVITPPENAQSSLVLNRAQTLQLGLTGTTQAQTTVLLSASDRSWSSSNTAVLSVNGNGLITGGEDGTAQVTVSIGGISSAPFSVVVNNATLQSITTIQGADTISVCRPSEYSAVGEFSDDSSRTLDTVTFTLEGGSDTTLTQPNAAIAALNPTAPGALTLTAQVGDIVSDGRQLTVIDNLSALSVTPVASSVDVDSTRQYTATGTYAIEAAGTAGEEQENITANVNWSIVEGGAFASVSNADSSRGVVSGISAGSATVQASCGNVEQDQQQVTVNDAGSSSVALSFEAIRQDNSAVIDLENDILVIGLSTVVQLRVARGSTFDEDNLVTTGLVFIARNQGSLEAISTVDIENGIVRPITDGGTAEVIVNLFEGNEPVAVGSITVRVSGL